jgi:tRNA (guanine-N7-)-methyltransferase
MDKHPSRDKPGTTENPYRRTVRSYVLRAGRVTEGQRRALEELWPLYGIDPGDDTLDFNALFDNEQPVVMEIGFGNGEATWRMAKACPEENFLGVEVHQPGVGRLLMNVREQGLTNVRVACEDAVELLRTRISDASLDGIRIYFPDPWPKKKHHKRRIVQTPFIDLLSTKMKAGGILHLATDWAPYAEFMLEVMQGSAEFENLSPSGDYCAKPAWRPPTKYEQRGERLGHEVADLVFRRTDRGVSG